MTSPNDIKSRWEETLKETSRPNSYLRPAVQYGGRVESAADPPSEFGTSPSCESSSELNPCLTGCRSVWWKIFLLFKDRQDAAFPGKWPAIMATSRSVYSGLRGWFMKYLDHPELLMELPFDPLQDSPDSPWPVLRADEILRAEIRQDVQRLPPEPHLYHEDHTQALILDILFVYCKFYPDRGGYRQGMHELLAPIVYILHQDAVERASSQSRRLDDNNPDQDRTSEVDPIMLDMLDSAFIEHDAFALFVKIMDRAKPFYELHSPTQPRPASPPGPAQAIRNSTIIDMSKHIHEVALLKTDPDLSRHLSSIDVLPQIFLIRWIRLLFGREFPFEQCLALWDAIFALDPSLQLIDWICVAMLLRIRWSLLEADSAVALTLLLKYPELPSPHGPHTLVSDALYLCQNPTTAATADLIFKYSGRRPDVTTTTAAAAMTVSVEETSPSQLRLHPEAQKPLNYSYPTHPPSTSRLAGGPSSSTSSTSSSTSSAYSLRQQQQQPQQNLVSSRPTLQMLGSIRQRTLGARSLPPNPAWLPSVIERGEKLGFKHAVQTAVGEIRRNVQGLRETTAPAAPPSRRTRAPPQTHPPRNNSPLDPPCPASPPSVSPPQALPPVDSPLGGQATAMLEQRNHELAFMLEAPLMTLTTMTSFRLTAANSATNQSHFVQSLERAASKIRFVKACLLDSSLSIQPPGDDLVTAAATLAAITPATPVTPSTVGQSFQIKEKGSRPATVVLDTTPVLTTSSVITSDLVLSKSGTVNSVPPVDSTAPISSTDMNEVKASSHPPPAAPPPPLAPLPSSSSPSHLPQSSTTNGAAPSPSNPTSSSSSSAVSLSSSKAQANADPSGPQPQERDAKSAPTPHTPPSPTLPLPHPSPITPARYSLAQSSFSWMIESDEPVLPPPSRTSHSPTKSNPVASSSSSFLAPAATTSGLGSSWPRSQRNENGPSTMAAAIFPPPAQSVRAADQARRACGRRLYASLFDASVTSGDGRSSGGEEGGSDDGNQTLVLSRSSNGGNGTGTNQDGKKKRKDKGYEGTTRQQAPQDLSSSPSSSSSSSKLKPQPSKAKLRARAKTRSSIDLLAAEDIFTLRPLKKGPRPEDDDETDRASPINDPPRP